MPAGRPSKITTTVEAIDPETGNTVQRPIVEHLCRYLRQGCYGANAARALGISPSTYGNWMQRGRDVAAQIAEHEGAEDGFEVDEADRPYLEFMQAATRAEAQGLVWHEMNVRRVAAGGKGDGRLSLEFLARRQPRRYSKRIEIDTDPGEREPAPIDVDTAETVEAAFRAGNVPDGIDPASVLPDLAGG